VADLAGGADGDAGGLVTVGGLLGGGEVTVTVGCVDDDGDGVGDGVAFRAFSTRITTTTITMIAMMTSTMLRNVWSGRGGGPPGPPQPC
jgi:hypothetical protein